MSKFAITALFFLCTSLLIIPRSVRATTYDGSLYTVTKNMSVTADVEPRPQDLSLSINASQPQAPSETFFQGQEVQFTINYLSLLKRGYPLKLTASWDKGVIVDSEFNYVDVYEYVFNSASNTVDYIVPVVDLQARNITWEIPRIVQTDENYTVSFKLRVRDLPTIKKIKAQARVKAVFSHTGMPEQNTTVFIKKELAKPQYFSGLSIAEITDNSATFLLQGPEPISYRFAYGVSSDSLNTIFSSLSLQEFNQIKLEKLASQQQYFFRINSKNAAGKIITSDIYTFTTSAPRATSVINNNDIVLSSNDIPLSSKNVNTDNLVLPNTTKLSIGFKLDNPQNFAQIVASFKNASVLGIDTFAAEPPPAQETRLVETVPGYFSGQLLTPNDFGQYNLIVELRDMTGGISTKALPQTIHISRPLTIYDAKTLTPVEKAKVLIYIVEDESSALIPLEQSLSYYHYTDNNGIINISLAPNTYLFKVTALGYKPFETKVELAISDNSYPQIKLTPTNSLIDRILYYVTSLQESFSNLIFYLKSYTNSNRTKDLSFVFIQLVLIVSTFVVLSFRLHTGFMGIFIFIYDQIVHIIRRILRLPITKIFILTEQNNFHKTIAGGHIHILDKNNKLLGKLRTNIIGHAFIPKKFLNESSAPINIFTYRNGYYSHPASLDSNSLKPPVINLFMFKDEVNIDSFSDFFVWLMDILLLSFFDLVIFSTCFLSFIFGIYQGWQNSLPFIISSLVALILWALFVKNIWILEHQNNNKSINN